jgi:hypothetical protein
MQLTQTLGLWYKNAHNQRKWAFQKYYDDIIHITSSSIDYYIYPVNQQQYQYKSYNKQPARPIVLQLFHVPVIPTHIGQETITCGDPIDSCHTPERPSMIQYIPILTNNIHPLIINGNDIINIASDGGLSQQHSTFGALISVNNTIITELNGSLPTQIHATSLTSEAYGCYYAIRKIWQQLDNNYNYGAINILLDNKTLISRLH